MAGESAGLLERFERQQIPATEFHHRDHVQVAFAMLDRYDFIDACTRYASTIRAMAESVGAADKYNVTITIAFMSLIAERKAAMDDSGFDALVAANPDLFDRNLLKRWYSDARLESDAARRQFLLPDKIAGSSVGRSSVRR